MSEDLDKIIHLLGLPKKHLSLLPLDGSRNMIEQIKIQCATSGFKFASVKAVKADLTEILLMRYSELQNTVQLGMGGIKLNVLGNWIGDILLDADNLYSIGTPSASLKNIYFKGNMGAGDITFLSGKKFLSDVTIDDAKKLSWSDIYFFRESASYIKTAGGIHAEAFKTTGNLVGASGSFTAGSGETVTVTNGLITSIV